MNEVNPEDLERHLGLVFFVKRQFSYLPDSRLDWDELLSWGTEGLAFAIEHYDPDRGRKFSTYACICIRGYMLQGIRSLSREIWRARKKGLAVSNISFAAMPEHLWPSYGHEDIDRGIDVSMQIEQLLSKVSPRTKEIVEFTLAHPEMTHAEVADYFDIARSTVGLAWNRTIQTGKKLWKVEEYREAA